MGDVGTGISGSSAADVANANYSLPPGVSPTLLAELQSRRGGPGSEDESSESSQEALDPNDLQCRAWIGLIEEQKAMSKREIKKLCH